MKKVFALAIVFISVSACVTVSGLTNDYDKLTPEQKAMVTDLQSFDQVEDGKIYTINGKELRQELSKHPKSLVYVLTNGCKSKHCKPLIVYDIYAKENGYKLFLVMNGFRDLNESLNSPHPWPLFAIDANHYNQKYRSAYVRSFKNELQGLPGESIEKEFIGELYFFSGDKLEKILRDLPQS